MVDSRRWALGSVARREEGEAAIRQGKRNLLVDGQRATLVIKGEPAKAAPDVRAKQALKVAATALMGDSGAGNCHRWQVDWASVPGADLHRDCLSDTTDPADWLRSASLWQAKLLRQRTGDQRGAGARINRKVEWPLSLNCDRRQHERRPVLALHHLDML